jgi:hypothetical protein
MALFVIVGTPFVYLIWEFVNHALSGRFVPLELGLALVGAVGAVFILRLVAHRASRWERQ